MPGWLSRFRHVYRDTVLPLPVGPVDEDHAVRPLDGAQADLSAGGLVAKRLDAELDPGRVEDPDHDLLAVKRGQRADPEIDRRLRTERGSSAVLRTRFSEMSSFEITLMRDANLSSMAIGGCVTSLNSPSTRKRTR